MIIATFLVVLLAGILAGIPVAFALILYYEHDFAAFFKKAQIYYPSFAAVFYGIA